MKLTDLAIVSFRKCVSGEYFLIDKNPSVIDKMKKTKQRQK